jgi:predicted transcriptional regulator
MNTEQPTQPQLVRDLMTVGVLTCSPSTSITTIAQALIAKDLEAAVVLDAEGHGIGTVGRDQLVGAFSRPDHLQLTAEDIMQDGVQQIPPDIPLTAAAQLMQDQHIRVFFLTHHAGGITYPAAVISYTHLIKYLAGGQPETPKDLGIGAERKAPLDLFYERLEEQRKHNLNTHLE